MQKKGNGIMKTMSAHPTGKSKNSFVLTAGACGTIPSRDYSVTNRAGLSGWEAATGWGGATGGAKGGAKGEEKGKLF
jgi:hypothetical protein